MCASSAANGARADGEVEAECVDGDAFAPLARGDDTTVLDTGNEKFIDAKYKGMFHFRDSIRQLSKSLEDLGPAFKVVQNRAALTAPIFHARL